MTPEQFCYWLRGKMELHPEPPTPEQWKCVEEHLDLVMGKVTPKLMDNMPDVKLKPITLPDLRNDPSFRLVPRRFC